MKKSLIALSVLAATSAFAGGVNPAAPVGLSDNGIGDLLMAPVYMTGGGWGTELKVVNNSTTFSTVAKVVFYENFRSTEVLDFFIFLTPGDAWNGRVACVASATNPCATITVTSTDDSALVASGTGFASAASPAVYSFAAPATIGYVGIFEEASWNLGAAPLAKSVVRARHDADNANGVTYLESDTRNILSGNVRLTNSINQAASTMPMTAWVNYDNRNPLQLGGLTVFGGDAGSPAYTNTLQLEDTIWQNNFSYPYDHSQGQTIGSITFPTRRTYDNLVHGTTIGRYPFNNVTKVPVNASVTMRDMQENLIAAAAVVTSPLPATVRPAFAELGFFVLATGTQTAADLDANGVLSTLRTGSFTEGWAQVVLDGVAGAAGTTAPVGAPAVATQLNWSANGTSLRSEWWHAQSYLSTFNVN